MAQNAAVKTKYKPAKSHKWKMEMAAGAREAMNKRILDNKRRFYEDHAIKMRDLLRDNRE